MKYFLDANIQAYRLHYPFDVFPAFWTCLQEQNEQGNIFSVSEIYDELKKGEDELWDWMQNREHWFLPVDEEATQRFCRDISDWIMNKDQFQKEAKTCF